MPDREKVIKGLDLCSNALYCDDPDSRCDQCPYRTKDMTGTDEMNCSDVLMSDALALLKEQPEIVRCRDCKWRGRCEGYDLIYDDDGFCSNGERRTDDA